jgi:hypothetical protein
LYSETQTSEQQSPSNNWLALADRLAGPARQPISRAGPCSSLYTINLSMRYN